jgi:hypothetical protein
VGNAELLGDLAQVLRRILVLGSRNSATLIPPPNVFESAIVATLPANGASYTLVVRGVNNTTGIAVVDVYALQ